MAIQQDARLELTFPNGRFCDGVRHFEDCSCLMRDKNDKFIAERKLEQLHMSVDWGHTRVTQSLSEESM